MLYDVPQTDQPTEPAMAAFIARLRASSPKPEALAASGTNITDATVAMVAARWIARVSNALSDRATMPLLRWDPDLDGCAITCAVGQLYNVRGRNRQAGADDTITIEVNEARDYLKRLGPGDDGNRASPQFIDSGNNRALDAPRLSTMPTSDAWTKLPDTTAASLPLDRSLGFPFP